VIFKRILFSALRVVIAGVAVIALLWWFGMRMPGKNISKAAPLSPDEVTLREELRADVQKLAGITRSSTPLPILSRTLFHTPVFIRGETVMNCAANPVTTSKSRYPALVQRFF
jgi:hypothetical protein